MVVGPGPMPRTESDLAPRELTPRAIGDAVERFRQAARRARRTGFRLKARVDLPIQYARCGIYA